MRDDFKRLWATNFLDDLSIDVQDYTFSNGVIGKLVTYNMEERERVKTVNYEGIKKIGDRAKVDEKLRADAIEMRIDSFADASVIRRIEGVLREMMAEKGYTNAIVSHKITPLAGGPKLVNVSFTVAEGPKIKIRRVDFVGNMAKSDRALKKKLKENKPKTMLSFILGGGTYQENKYEADADLVQTYYRVQLGGGLNVFPELIEQLPLPKPERLELPEADELSELARAAARTGTYDLARADVLARKVYGL